VLPLRELQLRVAGALFDGEFMPAVVCIEDNGIAPRARLDVYRNNLREGFRKALALGFPVIERLVGADCFAQLAGAFLAAHPSRSGDLHHIGAPFADFLRARYAAGEHGYLGDVAALEWACQQVGIGERLPAATAEDLRGIEPSRYETVHFSLHPTVRLVASDYPIVRIWLSNQAGAPPETIALDAGGDRVLVRDVGDGVEFHRLRAGEFALARAIAEGARLGEAAEQAMAAADSDFDLARALYRLLGAGALVLPQE
jgi:hypothetical protein